MSLASERLKALDGTALYVTNVQRADSRAYALSTLRDALPELIALVEAAENFDARFEERFIHGMAAPLNEAIAALDEKLSVT